MGQDHDALLASLKDIHLPPPIGWWPLAWGWFVLMACVILLLVGIVVWVRRHYLQTRAKRQALHLLELFQKQYQHNNDSQRACARISELLRRVAMAYYPRLEVASLMGNDWLIFLNRTSKGLDFTSVSHELLQLPYSNKQVANLNVLFTISRAWITQRRGRCLN